MFNGYGPLMRIFTKVSKVPFSHLRGSGFLSIVFVDDSYQQGNTYECLHDIESTIDLSQNLEFAIHATKSIPTPTKIITILGLVIGPVQMTLEITEEKKNKIYNLCFEILPKEKITLHTLATVIEIYRDLEHQKIIGIKLHYGKFDANIA